jgi:hypothetical protein
VGCNVYVGSTKQLQQESVAGARLGNGEMTIE